MNVNGNKPLKIALIHPDLGIGGAERLVVDTALGLQNEGNEVTIFTSHCDLTHCFEEIKNGTLKYKVYGDHLPTSIKEKFFIVCSNLRQLYLLWKMYTTGQLHHYDVFIVDQLSTCVPFIHSLTDAKILFYCHFPDQLLAQRTSLLKRIYRVPFDLLEQFTISAADEIVVNSNFTKQVYHKVFPYLTKVPYVIYPCVDINPEITDMSQIDNFDKKLYHMLVPQNMKYYLSINRYERKKNISLALKSFALSNEAVSNGYRLIIAGGYDSRVTENVEYLKELESVAQEYKLPFTTIKYQDLINEKDEDPNDFDKIKIRNTDKVIFLTSISSRLRDYLIQNMELLMYTPDNEHFGIVPLEAMRFGKPVLASNSGGPLETITSYHPNLNESTTTGWLRESNPSIWATAINEYMEVKNQIDFNHNSREKVRKHFSSKVMSDSFEESIERIIQKERIQYPWETALASIYYFSLHIAALYLFPNQYWPYLILVGYAGIWRKNYFWACYYAFIIILFSMSLE
ncbi:GDP-Man:Man(1)GlcNAc(2)-PP-dolichol alpha-1,3-mannosyltransferase PWA37_003356 [Arxiozyma heterogenica]|uniref:Alpha-1,3/1,6-mannosyltransferase ALG2 n=1 Tax=Arxiozyma heterogenica TaxID=278026 RepID=A0AAN8A970_9SACH|nr:hypothetical protein RI543_001827 [Kazachstania heterogenica]